MSLPELPYTQKRKEPQITEFRGVNYRESVRDGELQFSENMSSRRYPFLSPRRNRLTAKECVAPQSVWAGDKLVVIDDSMVWYGDGVDSLSIIGSVGGGQKQFAAINSKVVIWPDKVYVDLNTGTVHALESMVASAANSTATFTTDSVQLTGSVVEHKDNVVTDYKLEGFGRTNYYRYFKVYAQEDVSFSGGVWTLNNPTEYKSRDLYPDASALVGKIIMLQDGTTSLNVREEVYEDDTKTSETQYAANDSTGHYALVTDARSGLQVLQSGATYWLTEITFDVVASDGLLDLSTKFAVGDAVTVKRVYSPYTVYAEKAVIRGISGNTLTFDPNTFTAQTVQYAIQVSRDVPDLDYICASENRLWGVSNADEGKVWDTEKQEYVTVYNRVIYASSLGDPTNFYIYAGLSTDSYAVAVAGAGDFTGCVGFSGDALFFKENKIYRIYGDYPASYTLYTYDVPGVAAGSHLSCGIINDVLYYLAKDGVHAWSGGESQLVSYKLGPGPFSNGVAGVFGTLYYLSMQGEAWCLHVYDSVHNVWYREDDTQALGFAEIGGDKYMLTTSSLETLDKDYSITHVTESITYDRYSASMVLLINWTADRYYSLRGVAGKKFLIPQAAKDWVNTQYHYVDLYYTAERPGVVTMIRWYYATPVWEAFRVNADETTIPVISGGGVEKITTTHSTYAIQTEREEINTATWVTWRAVLADADEVIHQRKNYRWIRLRMVIPAYSTVRVFVSWDGSEDRQMWEATPEEDFEGTVNISLPPNRTDKIRVTLAGTGDMTLKSVIRAYNVGSVNTFSKGAV